MTAGFGRHFSRRACLPPSFCGCRNVSGIMVANPISPAPGARSRDPVALPTLRPAKRNDRGPWRTAVIEMHGRRSEALACRLLADTLLLEVFQRARMERDRRALLHLVVERKTLGFLVHGDDVGLLFHQRLDDAIGVLVAHLVAGDDQVPD